MLRVNELWDNITVEILLTFPPLSSGGSYLWFNNSFTHIHLCCDHISTPTCWISTKYVTHVHVSQEMYCTRSKFKLYVSIFESLIQPEYNDWTGYLSINPPTHLTAYQHTLCLFTGYTQTHTQTVGTVGFLQRGSERLHELHNEKRKRTTSRLETAERWSCLLFTEACCAFRGSRVLERAL